MGSNKGADIKLLTISAAEYVRANVKDLESYELVGIDASYTNEFHYGNKIGSAVKNARSALLSEAQSIGAEAVVDIRCSISQSFARTDYSSYHYRDVYLMGTALIPRKK